MRVQESSIEVDENAIIQYVEYSDNHCILLDYAVAILALVYGRLSRDRELFSTRLNSYILQAQLSDVNLVRDFDMTSIRHDVWLKRNMSSLGSYSLWRRGCSSVFREKNRSIWCLLTFLFALGGEVSRGAAVHIKFVLLNLSLYGRGHRPA
jgi:hypothetical protein